MANKTTISLGGGFLNLLTIVFITLKLTGHIDWSWWIVISPWLAKIAILILAFALLVIIKVITDK
jgi:hypothetical protein